MVFCNTEVIQKKNINTCHNPYFNRWFSAIQYKYFNGKNTDSHNPYFNRWFSAICSTALLCPSALKVTILILIDGFLQCKW